jgi:hypothetical protein
VSSPTRADHYPSILPSASKAIGLIRTRHVNSVFKTLLGRASMSCSPPVLFKALAFSTVIDYFIDFLGERNAK